MSDAPESTANRFSGTARKARASAAKPDARNLTPLADRYVKEYRPHDKELEEFAASLGSKSSSNRENFFGRIQFLCGPLLWKVELKLPTAPRELRLT